MMDQRAIRYQIEPDTVCSSFGNCKMRILLMLVASISLHCREAVFGSAIVDSHTDSPGKQLNCLLCLCQAEHMPT